MEKSLYNSPTAQWICYIVLFIAFAVIPLFVSDSFLINQLSTYGVYGLLALSISVCWGFGGILNLGQGMAFGLAAYGMGMTMQMQSQNPVSDPMPPFMLNNSVTQLPWFWEPFWSTGWGVFLALAIPTLFCALFGTLMFRARVSGPFVAIMTLALLSAWYTLILDAQPFTNGVNGITPPNPLKLFGHVIDPYSPLCYWIVLGALALMTFGSKLILQSRFGLIAQAVRDDAERVRFLGYNVAYYETVIFTISAFIAAVAGCCWVMLVQYVSPAQLDVFFSVSIVIWAGVGGRLSLLGAIIGAFLINGAQSYVGDEFLNTWLLILGGFFILVVRFLPRGLAGLLEMILARFPIRGSPSGVARDAKPQPSR
jgi:urea transport system permease protein